MLISKITKHIRFSKFFSIDYSYDTRNFLSKFQEYERKLEDTKREFEILETALPGSVSIDAVDNYINKHKSEIHADNFNRLYPIAGQELPRMTSIGIGSYLGNPDDVNDFYVFY